MHSLTFLLSYLFIDVREEGEREREEGRNGGERENKYVVALIYAFLYMP